MTDYLIRRNANTHGAFETSRRTDATIARARQAAADLVGAETDEIVFGNNMTSLTFHLSRSLASEFGPKDEIVVTRLDHDADVMPWVMLGEDTGATVHWADVDMETCTLDMDHLRSLITPRTKLVAVGYASNASGTINDVKTVIGWAKANGAYTFIDAVQYAPHGLIDVKELDCDFLACSAYKFFGPHVGILYGKREHLERLRAYRVRPAGDAPPDKWEQGTKNHEGLAGIAAAIDYIAELGVDYGGAFADASRREKLRAAWTEIASYEQMLIERLIEGIRLIPRRAHLWARPAAWTGRGASPPCLCARRERRRNNLPKRWPPRISSPGTAISMRLRFPSGWAWRPAAACCASAWCTTTLWTRSTVACACWIGCRQISNPCDSPVKV